jgi:hypothetical protein
MIQYLRVECFHNFGFGIYQNRYDLVIKQFEGMIYFKSLAGFNSSTVTVPS